MNMTLTNTVLENTETATTPLVPEIPLRLLRRDSSLWRAFDEGPEAAALPRAYWAFAWSGGQSLARYALDHREQFAGRRVLDFAAGCGIAAIAAKMAGAIEVTAGEIDPLAIAAIAENARQNHVEVATVCEDLIYSPNPGWDVVLVGDVWYDTRLARHGLNWLRTLAAAGVLVLGADPGRHYSPSNGTELLAAYQVRSVPDLEHPNLQECRVYRILAA